MVSTSLEIIKMSIRFKVIKSITSLNYLSISLYVYKVKVTFDLFEHLITEFSPKVKWKEMGTGVVDCNLILVVVVSVVTISR